MGRFEWPDQPRRVEVWWVLVDEPVTRLLCAAGGEEATLFGVLYDMRADHGAIRRQTDADGVVAVDLPRAMSRFAVPRENMQGLMRVLRANGVRGRYRMAGTDEPVYEF